MMDCEQLLALLGQHAFECPVERHERIYTMAQSDQLVLQLEGMRCKNLLLQDKKGVLYLVVTSSGKAVDLQALSAVLGSARLSFASAERLLEVLGVTPGELSPLALINDRHKQVHLVMDQAIGDTSHYLFHPLDCGVSIQVSPSQLVRFLCVTGHSANSVPVTARGPSRCS